MAERLAVKYSANNIFDYIQLTPEYAIYEIPTPKSWEGKTIRDKGVRAKYNLNILAVKRGGSLTPLPSADHMFSSSERLMSCAENPISKNYLTNFIAEILCSPLIQSIASLLQRLSRFITRATKFTAAVAAIRIYCTVFPNRILIQRFAKSLHLR